jgi:hypothetical protein
LRLNRKNKQFPEKKQKFQAGLEMANLPLEFRDGVSANKRHAEKAGPKIQFKAILILQRKKLIT